jgi:hypothetical protein
MVLLVEEPAHSYQLLCDASMKVTSEVRVQALSPQKREPQQIGEDGPDKSNRSGLSGPFWTMTENGEFVEVLLNLGVPDGI